MARIFTPLTLQILLEIQKNPKITTKELHRFHSTFAYKELYNTVFRLADLELIKKEPAKGEIVLTITPDGEKSLKRNTPKRDGVWKLVIFDISEKQKYVRVVLRAKLKALHFKKWQNSIWVSPYELDEEIERELKDLGNKFFVRLIKTKDINIVTDLEKLFE